MSIEFVALLATIGGGVLTAVGTYIAAWFSSDTEDKISLRDTLMKRVNELDHQQRSMRVEMEEIRREQQKWVRRYWALYRWTLRHCLVNSEEDMPPDFHEMEKGEIEQNLKNMYPQHDMPNKS